MDANKLINTISLFNSFLDEYLNVHSAKGRLHSSVILI